MAIALQAPGPESRGVTVRPCIASCRSRYDIVTVLIERNVLYSDFCIISLRDRVACIGRAREQVPWWSLQVEEKTEERGWEEVQSSALYTLNAWGIDSNKRKRLLLVTYKVTHLVACCQWLSSQCPGAACCIPSGRAGPAPACSSTIQDGIKIQAADLLKQVTNQRP